MDRFSRSDLGAVMSEHTDPCISLFMPMERAGKETRQNAIRFKNMLNQAGERLRERGLDDTTTQQILEPAQARLNDSIFWQHQSDGLAVFCAPDFCHIYRLPLAFEELLLVSDRFHIKPVLPLFTNNEHFFVLALSKHSVRLFDATRYSISQMELPEETPTSLEEAVSLDDPEKQLQFRTNVPRGGGEGQAPAFHGHHDPDERVQLERYFLEVDRGVSEVLKEQQAPLVLMGVDYLLPLYRDRTSYSNVYEEGVTGNPDLLKPEEVHEQAWQVMEPLLDQQRQAAVERFHQDQARDLAASDLKEVVSGAVFGRVDTLFVPSGVHWWGRFEQSENRLDLHDEHQPGDEDMLDLAALHTLTHGGIIYTVEPEQVPSDGPAAAIFRYPA